MQTRKDTNMATTRLNGPWGQFSEKLTALPDMGLFSSTLAQNNDRKVRGTGVSNTGDL